MSFRPLTRATQQLSEADCIRLLETETRGVLSVIGDGGYPYGMPMNHWYNPADGAIYFHCGLTGHRVDALRQNPKVSFCVYNQGTRADGEWAYTVQSVIVFGQIEMLRDIETVSKITRRLCDKFTNDRDYIEREIASAADHTLLLKLIPAHICGKRVQEA